VLVPITHQLQSACSNNPPTAKCSIQKPTNCCVWIAVGGFLEKAFRSWLAIETSFFAVGGFSEQAYLAACGFFGKAFCSC